MEADGRSDQPHKQQQANGDAAKPKKADLPVAQRQQLFKHAPPPDGRQKWQQSFDHQQQGQCDPEVIATVHDGLFFCRRGSGRIGAAARSAHRLEEIT